MKRGKVHQRTLDRINLIIRLEKANPQWNLAVLASHIGISQVRLSIIRAHPLYRQLHNQYMTGVVTRLDQKVDRNLELTRASLDFAVPLAMEELVKQALHAKDERVKNKACNDILDRDGHFAKVTRVGLATGEQGGAGTTRDDDTAAALLAAVNDGNKPNINSPSPSTKTQ